MIKFARDSINVYLIGEEKSQCPEDPHKTNEFKNSPHAFIKMSCT